MKRTLVFVLLLSSGLGLLRQTTLKSDSQEDALSVVQAPPDSCPRHLPLGVTDISFAPDSLFSEVLSVMKLKGQNSSADQQTVVNLSMAITKEEDQKISSEFEVKIQSINSGADFEIDLAATPVFDWSPGTAHFIIVLTNKSGREVGCITGTIQVGKGAVLQVIAVLALLM